MDNTIILKGVTPEQYDDKTAGGAGIVPGNLLLETASAVTNAGANADLDVVIVAREPDYVGGGLDHAFAATDEIPLARLKVGDQVKLRVAAGEAAIADQAYLAPDTNGTVKAAADKTTAGVFAKAMEAVDNSGGASATHVKAIIIQATQAAS